MKMVAKFAFYFNSCYQYFCILPTFCSIWIVFILQRYVIYKKCFLSYSAILHVSRSNINATLELLDYQVILQMLNGLQTFINNCISSEDGRRIFYQQLDMAIPFHSVDFRQKKYLTKHCKILFRIWVKNPMKMLVFNVLNTLSNLFSFDDNDSIISWNCP